MITMVWVRMGKEIETAGRSICIQKVAVKESQLPRRTINNAVQTAADAESGRLFCTKCGTGDVSMVVLSMITVEMWRVEIWWRSLHLLEWPCAGATVSTNPP